MKRIMADYLRRWGWAYLLGMAFTGLIDVMWTSYTTDAHSSFIFVCLFMLPLVVDLKEGHIGAMAALPVSRRATALHCWVATVILPVLAVAGAFVAAGLVSVCFFTAPPLVVLLTSLAYVVLAALVMTGASCCGTTSFQPVAPEEVNRFSGLWMLLWMLLWFPVLILAIGFYNRFDITKQSLLVWLAVISIAILLCARSWRQSEGLVIARTKARRGQSRSSSAGSKRTPSCKPGMTRFGGVFFGNMWSGFVFGLVFAMVSLAFRLREGEFFWAWLLAFGTLGSVGLLSGGARFLRSLPLSVGHLALMLLLLPISCMLGTIAALGALEFVYPGFAFGFPPAFCLIPVTGAICLVSSLVLPFVAQTNRFVVLPLAMLVSCVIFVTVPEVHWPAPLWWLLGLCLVVAAFFLNRYWLRSSDPYRPSAGVFSRR